MDDSRQEEANEHGGVIDEDGWVPEVNFAAIVEICEYALTLEICDIDDLSFQILLSLKIKHKMSSRNSNQQWMRLINRGLGHPSLTIPCHSFIFFAP